jgi:sugar lactone lactonase YvrE
MKNRFFTLVIVLVSIVFLCGCSSGPSEDKNVPDETLPNETQENVSTPSILSSDDTCLSVIPIYSNAQFQADKQNDLESLVNTMATLSGVSGGKVAVYITPDGLESVIEFYQGHPPTGGYEKTLDLTSAEEGGIIVWEKGEMSAQMFSAIEEGQTVILLGCGPKLGSSAAPSLPVVTSEDGLADDTITSVDFSADGSAWIATPDGLSLFDGQSWTTFNADNGLPGDWIVDVAISDSGDVWASVSDSSYQGLARFDGAAWVTFDPLTKPGPIAVAPNGAVWVGVCDVNDGGVYRFDGQEYTYYDEGFVGDVCVQDLFSTEDGSFWVAKKSTIAQFDGNNWSVYTGEDGLVGEPRTIFVDQNGLVWVGTDAGVSRFDGQTWTTYTQEDGLAGQEVNAITEGSDGSLWFGTSNGVSRLKDGTWQSFTEDDGLPGNRVSSIAIAPDGRIWVGTTFDGVAIIEPEK